MKHPKLYASKTLERLPPDPAPYGLSAQTASLHSPVPPQPPPRPPDASRAGHCSADAAIFTRCRAARSTTIVLALHLRATRRGACRNRLLDRLELHLRGRPGLHVAAGAVKEATARRHDLFGGAVLALDEVNEVAAVVCVVSAFRASAGTRTLGRAGLEGELGQTAHSRPTRSRHPRKAGRGSSASGSSSTEAPRA